MSESARTSQPPNLHENQVNPNSTTLGAIAQTGISQSINHISIDGKRPWILDSGATNHLTGSSKLFVFHVPCAGNETIKITDGSLALIVGKGKISPCAGLSLHHVLHVPKISYNSLSISKITRDLNCKATFLLFCLFSRLELGEDDWHCST